MRAAVYLRVSTDRQDEANQEPECIRLCAARGWEPVLFREQESGAKARPIWQSVLQSVHQGDCGAVVVWSLDRAGRDRVRLCHDLAEIARKGSVVASVRESWIDQPPGLMRDLLISILTWVAEYERARLVERTRAGLARAKSQGKTLGRRPVDPAIVECMRRAWLVGKPPSHVGRVLSVPGATVRTYYARFEAAEKGTENAAQKTAETQEG
jgi:DNA invertase Pin-like site-specific DNA recombinase